MKNFFIVKHTTCKTWSRRRVRYKQLGRLVVGGSALRIGCPVCGAHILLQSPALPDVHLTLKSLGHSRPYCTTQMLLQTREAREGGQVPAPAAEPVPSFPHRAREWKSGLAHPEKAEQPCGFRTCFLSQSHKRTERPRPLVAHPDCSPDPPVTGPEKPNSGVAGCTPRIPEGSSQVVLQVLLTGSRDLKVVTCSAQTRVCPVCCKRLFPTRLGRLQAEGTFLAQVCRSG